MSDDSVELRVLLIEDSQLFKTFNVRVDPVELCVHCAHARALITVDPEAVELLQEHVEVAYDVLLQGQVIEVDTFLLVSSFKLPTRFLKTGDHADLCVELTAFRSPSELREPLLQWLKERTV